MDSGTSCSLLDGTMKLTVPWLRDFGILHPGVKGKIDLYNCGADCMSRRIAPQGLDAQDRAIRGLSMHEERAQLVWMQRIGGSGNGPRVSRVISLGYLGGGTSI